MEDTTYLIDVNKDNLDRVIGFVDVIDGKAKFILSLVLALTAYLVAQLGPYLDAHAKWGTGPLGAGLLRHTGSRCSGVPGLLH